MATKIIPYIAAAVMAVAGAQSASAQYPQVQFHPIPTYQPPTVPYTPPLGYQVPQPYFAQPAQPYNQPRVFLPPNAFGSTIRP